MSNLMNEIEAVSRNVAARLDQIGTLSIRIQAAESVGLYAIAERLRDRMDKLKAELAPLAEALEASRSKAKMD